MLQVGAECPENSTKSFTPVTSANNPNFLLFQRFASLTSTKFRKKNSLMPPAMFLVSNFYKKKEKNLKKTFSREALKISATRVDLTGPILSS